MKNLIQQTFIGLVAAFFGCTPVRADGLTHWMRRAPAPYGTLSNTTYYAGLTFGDRRFVGVGAGGVVVHSTNGVDWTKEPSISLRYLRSVNWGNDVFVAVGDAGKIYCSSDAIEWTERASGLGEANDLYGVAYGNNRYVAVGNYGVSIVSTNGTNWTYYPGVLGGNQTACYEVAFGAGRFIAVGDGGYIGASADGVTWTNPFSTGVQLLSVAFGSAGFAAGDYLGGIYFSSNGLAWEHVLVGNDDTFGRSVTCIAFGNGNFVALSGGAVLKSADGINWEELAPAALPAFGRALAFGHDTFVAAGFGGQISQTRELSIPELSIFRGVGNSVNLTLSGAVDRQYTVEWSEDLFEWNDWITFTNSSPTTTLTNLSGGGGLHHFYRARRD